MLFASASNHQLQDRCFAYLLGAGIRNERPLCVHRLYCGSNYHHLHHLHHPQPQPQPATPATGIPLLQPPAAGGGACSGEQQKQPPPPASPPPQDNPPPKHQRGIQWIRRTRGGPLSARCGSAGRTPLSTGLLSSALQSRLYLSGAWSLELRAWSLELEGLKTTLCKSTSSAPTFCSLSDCPFAAAAEP